MSRGAIPTWFFVLAVVRRQRPGGTNEYLLVHERAKHGSSWYLPAGRVEPGETLTEATHRETLEESGVALELEGLLRVEHTPMPNGTRVRVFLLARPAPGSEPRSTPNEHTQGAAFYTPEEAASLALRGRDVLEVLRAVDAGAPVAPLSLLTFEGAPWT